MKRVALALVLLLLALGGSPALAAAPAGGGATLELKLNDPAAAGGVGGAGVLRIVLLMTVLAVAPSILLLMTCFVRMILALHFLRQALGTPQMPPNQVVVGLALFLTLFVMSPTVDRIHKEAWVP